MLPVILPVNLLPETVEAFHVRLRLQFLLLCQHQWKTMYLLLLRKLLSSLRWHHLSKFQWKLLAVTLLATPQVNLPLETVVDVASRTRLQLLLLCQHQWKTMYLLRYLLLRKLRWKHPS